MGIAQRYLAIRKEIDTCCLECGRDPSEVLLLAVSKTVGPERIPEAIEAGACDFGENRPEQIVAREADYPQVNWHFIGNVQSRRIDDIVSCAHLIHSIYKTAHLAKVDAAAARHGKIQRILLEVNVSGEESKSGLSPEEVEPALRSALTFSNIEVCGLMTMAPHGDAVGTQAAFEGLAALRSRLDGLEGTDGRAVHLNELSMGMSEDWRVAIPLGATIVRVGRAIFSDDF